MRTKINIFYFLSFLILSQACEKPVSEVDINIQLKIIDIVETNNGVSITSEITGTGLSEANIPQYGFCWSIDGVPTYLSGGTNQKELGSYASGTTFTSEISGLEEGTTYSFRSFIICLDKTNTNGRNDFYSEVDTITITQTNTQTENKGTWIQKTPPNNPTPDNPNAMYQACAFVLEDTAYIGLGRENNGTSLFFWQYVPSNNEWTKITDFPNNQGVSGEGIILNSKGYVVTNNSVIHYNNIIDDWEDLAYTDQEAIFSTGDKLYRTDDGDFDVYNENSQQWDYISASPYPCEGSAIGFSIDGIGYVGSNSYLKVLHRYNVDLNLWDTVEGFPGESRVGAVYFVMNKKFYYGLGKKSGTNQPYLNDFWEYNPSTDTWREINSIRDFNGKSKYLATGFSIGNKGYIAFGKEENPPNNAINTKEVWELSFD